MLTDKEIIKKIKNGEIDYFSLIVKKYTNSIFNYIKNKIKKREDAEDLTQNVFISFYKAIERFDEEKPVKPYLYQIVNNQLKMYYRSRNQMLLLKENIYLTDDYFTDKTDNIDIDNIENKINFLNKQEKKMLLMIVEGYSYQEVADKFKKPLNTVKSIIRRARIKLKVKSQKSKVNEKT